MVQGEDRTWNKTGTWWDRAAGKSAVGWPIKTPEKINLAAAGGFRVLPAWLRSLSRPWGQPAALSSPPGTRDEAPPALSAVEHKHPRGFLLSRDIPGARGEGGQPPSAPLPGLCCGSCGVPSPQPGSSAPRGAAPCWGGTPYNPPQESKFGTGTSFNQHGEGELWLSSPLGCRLSGAEAFWGGRSPRVPCGARSHPAPSPIGVVWGSAAPRALAVTLGRGPAGPAASRGGEGHGRAPARALLPHGAPGIWALSFFPINPPLIAVLGSPC